MKNQIIKKPFRVAIEGNVGAGKSTLIKYFEHFNEVETNPVIIDLFSLFTFFLNNYLTHRIYLNLI